jgi:anthranilate phosphoribosyltransferase
MISHSSLTNTSKINFAQKVYEDHLSAIEAYSAYNYIMQYASDAEIGAILMGLKCRTESSEEILGFARAMRDTCIKVEPRLNNTLIDTCGTGGDSSGTFNVSTASALVASAAGLFVAKHGNYSVTSHSGSADVLKELGISIVMDPKMVKRSIEERKFGFMLAQAFHPAVKRVAHIRRELGFRTIFNVLGPLTNPANPDAQVLGVYDPRLCAPLANVLNEIGLKRAYVVHGDGLDEFTNTGSSLISELKGKRVDSYEVAPDDFGFETAKKSSLVGGSPQVNAAIIEGLFDGRVKDKNKGEFLLLNAGAAVSVGIGCTIVEGIEIAKNVLEEGLALMKLNELRGEL